MKIRALSDPGPEWAARAWRSGLDFLIQPTTLLHKNIPLIEAHPQVMFNLKTPLYNHRLLSQSITDPIYHLTL